MKASWPFISANRGNKPRANPFVQRTLEFRFCLQFGNQRSRAADNRRWAAPLPKNENDTKLAKPRFRFHRFGDPSGSRLWRERLVSIATGFATLGGCLKHYSSLDFLQDCLFGRKDEQAQPQPGAGPNQAFRSS